MGWALLLSREETADPRRVPSRCAALRAPSGLAPYRDIFRTANPAITRWLEEDLLAADMIVYNRAVAMQEAQRLRQNESPPPLWQGVL